MHFVSSGLVPILVRSLRLKVSVGPLNSTEGNGSKSTVTSFASVGLLVMPVRHRAAPEATRTPFLNNSARRSNLVPMSSLFFKPTHAWRLLGVGRSPTVRAGWPAHVPIVTHGFPAKNARSPSPCTCCSQRVARRRPGRAYWDWHCSLSHESRGHSCTARPTLVGARHPSLPSPALYHQ